MGGRACAANNPGDAEGKKDKSGNLMYYKIYRTYRDIRAGIILSWMSA
jgi:hypothetical protein